MYNLIFSAILGFATFSPLTFNSDFPPTLIDFQTQDKVEVLHLGIEKKGVRFL